MIKTMHVITERSKLITYISDLIFVWSFDYEEISDYITTYTNQMVAQSCDG